MKHGYYADDELPNFNPAAGYKTNSLGYRCPEFRPLPDGGKNVVVLGCSHTFGEGLEEDETWVSQVAKQSNKILRWWNLGQPGASADLMIRILYGTEKVLFPNTKFAKFKANTIAKVKARAQVLKNATKGVIPTLEGRIETFDPEFPPTKPSGSGILQFLNDETIRGLANSGNPAFGPI